VVLSFPFLYGDMVAMLLSPSSLVAIYSSHPFVQTRKSPTRVSPLTS
jgi:hypothetical protein